MDSPVEMKRYSYIASVHEEALRYNGKCFRQVILDSLRPLVAHMLANGEDDTKSLTVLNDLSISSSVSLCVSTASEIPIIFLI